ncbi:hypothetical protein ACOL23_12495, partial [Aliarcobacter butzleri]
DVLKMATCIYIPQFNRVLVTGIYADDIEREIKQLTDEINKDINTLFCIAIIVTILLSIILVFIIIPTINKIILKPLN